MKCILVGFLMLGAAVAQGGATATPKAVGKQPAGGKPAPAADAGKAKQEPGKSLSAVNWQANGWPVVHGDPAPVGETGTASARAKASAKDQSKPGGRTQRDQLAPQRRSNATLPSGSDLDSPLLEVFRATRSPGLFQRIGGIQVWWQLTTYGPAGEVRGTRNLTQISDCSRPRRDRLEMPNGDVFTRSGDRVGAQRDGIPWDSLQDDAKAHLELFGTHVRMPWCFGDAAAYAIIRKQAGDLEGEPLTRLWLRERPETNEEIFGPLANPKPRDQFRLGYEPTTGFPRELEHRFVGMGRRRVLLDDWKEVYGVNWPHTRIYVDDRGQKTTVLTIQRLRTLRVTEADFRQL